MLVKFSIFLYCNYVFATVMVNKDEYLVKYVNKAIVGCRIRAICTAILLYADDVILLAPSVSALQVLIGILCC